MTRRQISIAGRRIVRRSVSLLGPVAAEPVGGVDYSKLGLTSGHLFALDVDTTFGRALDVVIPIPGEQPLSIKLNPYSVRGEGFKCFETKDGGLNEVDAVAAAAQKSGRLGQVGFQWRADPRFVQPMKLVHDGEIGDLIENRVLWSNSWGRLTGWIAKRAPG